MTKHFFDNIALVSIFSALIPIVFYILRFKEHARQNHIIGALLFVGIAIDLVMWFLYIQKRSTLALNNLYVIISFLLITAFYYEIVFKKRAVYAFVVCLLFFVGIWIQAGVTTGISAVNNYTWAITGAIIGIYSVLYICIIPSMIIDRFLDRFLYGNAIISMSFSFYFFATLFLFCLSDFVFTALTANESRVFWSIHNTCNIVKNLGLALGLFLSGKRKTYLTLEQLEKMSKEELFR